MSSPKNKPRAIGSFGRLGGASGAATESIAAAVGRLVAEAKAKKKDAPPRTVHAHFARMAKGVIAGWLVLLETYQEGEEERWHASASLHPRGRASTDEDWAKLGRIVACSGAPGVAHEQIRQQIRFGTHPNEAHHWMWTAEKSEPPS